MALLKKLFSSGAKELVVSVGNAIDKIHTSAEEKELIKEAIKLSETYNMWDKVSLQVALKKVNQFLKTKFNFEKFTLQK